MGLLALVVASALGCGGGGSGPSRPTPQAVERSDDRSTPGDAAPDTALPADLPEALELEVRRRTQDGEDRVVKLTPAGARYGLSHGKARIALRYRLEEGALAAAWQALRREGFDRLETVAREGGAQAGGTSVRVSTGSETYTSTAMGRQEPTAEDAEAYARCVAAVEALLPAGRSDVVVEIRWDASMKDRSAGLDVDVGSDLVGLHRAATTDAAKASVGAPSGSTPGEADGLGRLAPPLETFELHLAKTRPVELQLRQGGNAPRSIMLTVRAGEERGVEVAFDAALGEAVLRPLAATPEPPTSP